GLDGMGDRVETIAEHVVTGIRNEQAVRSRRSRLSEHRQVIGRVVEQDNSASIRDRREWVTVVFRKPLKPEIPFAICARYELRNNFHATPNFQRAPRARLVLSDCSVLPARA